MNRIVLGKKIVKKEGKIVTGIVPGKKTVKKKRTLTTKTVKRSEKHTFSSAGYTFFTILKFENSKKRCTLTKKNQKE